MIHFDELPQVIGDFIVRNLTTKRNFDEPFPVHDERSSWNDPNGRLSIIALDGHARGSIRFRYDERLSVDLAADGDLIVNAAIGIDPAVVDHFVADQVIPRAMDGNGQHILHAAMIGIGNRAILILGASGRGKSTLAASFHSAGWRLFGDDATIISWVDGCPSAEPVYRSLRLLPDSIAALFPTSVESEAVSDMSWKRQITLDPAAAPFDRPIIISAIFLIAPPDDSTVIEIRPLTSAELCMALVANAFACNPADIEQAHARLDKASRLATAVPAYSLSYPRDFHFLGDIRAAMIDRIGSDPK